MFRGIWTPFDIDFPQCKKHGKTATGTWHYVNRLVPKNDYKMIIKHPRLIIKQHGTIKNCRYVGDVSAVAAEAGRARAEPANQVWTRNLPLRP